MPRDCTTQGSRKRVLGHTHPHTRIFILLLGKHNQALTTVCDTEPRHDPGRPNLGSAELYRQREADVEK